jgi:hypothetical protein
MVFAKNGKLIRSRFLRAAQARIVNCVRVPDAVQSLERSKIRNN